MLRAWLTLKLVNGLGSRGIKVLIERFGDPQSVLEADESSLSEVVGPKRAKAIKERRGVNERLISEVETVMREEGIGCLTLSDPDYPPPLKTVPDPPPLLFYLGELRGTPLVGVVGPRRPSAYTLAFVERTVSTLVEEGFGTVSGGASGVDMKIHLSTVQSSGYTVCVLGSGVLKAGEGVLKLLSHPGTLLLSELLPFESATKYTFPLRNRIIAGMSEFLIVPEAGMRSGSLITANHAHRYGREVYAHIRHGSRWEGCSRLVREGKAKPLRSVEEILKPKRTSSSLEEFLKIPRTFDEIARFLGRPSSEVMFLLTDLELKGRLRRQGPFYTMI